VACAHRCLVRPGRRGICGVRENRDGQLVSLVYGEAVSAALDPIEKKPLFHAWPGSTSFSIATAGCNFHCRHCQNWEISQAPHLGLAIPARQLPPERVVRQALDSGARSVAYTYVEPTVFLEYLVDTARLAHRSGLANVMVTNGYHTPEVIGLLAPLVDAANVDLKAFDDRFYRRVCGGRLAPVLESLVAWRRSATWLEVTTLLIPGLNDSEAELRALTGWLVRELGPETPWHVSRFFPAYRMTDVPATPLRTMERAVEIGREAGLCHVYAGNLDAERSDTDCAGCGATLLRRRGYRLTMDRLVAGACPGCGRRLAGIGLEEVPVR
jgi:pyruvate formate lyase activating enzyme